jgi:hypothetical protein
MRNLGSLRLALAPTSIIGIGIGIGPAPAYADEPIAGSYEAKFEQVANNCDHPIAYPARGAIKIDIKGGDLQVDIDRTPLMTGKMPRPGKIDAKSPKPGRTPVEGMDGVFQVAGRITSEGMLSLMLVGEYQTAGKPLCTQSWNLSGLKARADKPEQPKK